VRQRSNQARPARRRSKKPLCSGRDISSSRPITSPSIHLAGTSDRIRALRDRSHVLTRMPSSNGDRFRAHPLAISRILGSRAGQLRKTSSQPTPRRTDQIDGSSAPITLALRTRATRCAPQGEFEHAITQPSVCGIFPYTLNCTLTFGGCLNDDRKPAIEAHRRGAYTAIVECRSRGLHCTSAATSFGWRTRRTDRDASMRNIFLGQFVSDVLKGP